jgi:hypothetical protein
MLVLLVVRLVVQVVQVPALEPEEVVASYSC